MTELVTVPTFSFSQGDVYEGYQLPVSVRYYNGLDDSLEISIAQEDIEIVFSNLQVLKALVKEIERHHSEAYKNLKSRK